MKAYSWGSHTYLQRLTGTSVGEPLAEIWIGTHTRGPAYIADTGAELKSVSGQLPFLFKVLAAKRPLSLQVHPDAEQAMVGFDFENRLGLDPSQRSFSDASPKPELVVALTQLESLIGFRPTDQIVRSLDRLTPMTQSLARQLQRQPGYYGLVSLLSDLLHRPPGSAEIRHVVTACRNTYAAARDHTRACRTAVELAEIFGDDIGVLVSLFLNRVTLEEGRAMLLEPGTLHSHLQGEFIEVTGASDNVLRAGLTDKHVDPAGVIECVKRTKTQASPLAPSTPAPGLTTYQSSVHNLMIALGRMDHASIQLPYAGRRLVLCLDGSVVAEAESDAVELVTGDCLYLASDQAELKLKGSGVVAQASASTVP